MSNLRLAFLMIASADCRSCERSLNRREKKQEIRRDGGVDKFWYIRLVDMRRKGKLTCEIKIPKKGQWGVSVLTHSRAQCPYSHGSKGTINSCIDLGQTSSVQPD